MKLKCDVCGREFPKCEFIEESVIPIADNFQACEECRAAWAEDVKAKQAEEPFIGREFRDPEEQLTRKLARKHCATEATALAYEDLKEQLGRVKKRVKDINTYLDLKVKGPDGMLPEKVGDLQSRVQHLESELAGMDARDKPTESVLTKEFFGGEIAGLSDKMFSGACKWTQDNLSKQNSAYRTLHLKAAMELAQEFFRRRKPTEKKRSGYFKGVAITDLTDKQFVEACEFAQATLHRAMLFEIGRSWKTEPAGLLAIQLGATMELAQEFARRRNRTKENTTSEPSNTETEPDTVVHED